MDFRNVTQDLKDDLAKVEKAINELVAKISPEKFLEVYGDSIENLNQLVKQKTGKEIILQEPISPLGSKLLNSLNKWK